VVDPSKWNPCGVHRCRDDTKSKSQKSSNEKQTSKSQHKAINKWQIVMDVEGMLEERSWK
jgi:hypothetical protein